MITAVAAGVKFANSSCMPDFRTVMEWTGTAIDAGGVIIIVIGALFAGLEFLVAGDIIRTVVVAPTLANVIVLAGIVLIRTFLSMSLELELEGHWPWQKTDPVSRRPSASAETIGKSAGC